MWNANTNGGFILGEIYVKIKIHKSRFESISKQIVELYLV